MATTFCGRLSNSWSKIETEVNNAISASVVGKYFKLEERKTCLTREFRAGTTTFLAMAYVISVISAMLADTGGTCKRSEPEYEACVAVVKNDLIVAISLAAMMGCVAMGTLANLPFGLAPGTGQTMYMAYNLVGIHGNGPMSYEGSMGLWVVEAAAFLVISGSGLRSKLGRLIPLSVRLACAVGIGVFMASIGLQVHQGLGLVGPDKSTMVAMTACAQTDMATGECISGKLHSPTFWLGLVGLLIMSYGMAHDVKGSMIYGILFVTLISWFRGTSVTYFPKTEIGDARHKYFKKVVDFHLIHKIAGKVSFKEFTKLDTWLSLLTVLYIDILATTGSLYTLSEIGGFIDDKGTFENEYVAYMIDAATTVVGSFLGVPPVGTYGESATGIKEGGRTGLTAVIIGLYFLLSLFFAPIFTSVPPWAIGPSLVMVGVIMMRVVKDIDWGNISEAVPAFVTIILMPLTASIPIGIVAGIGVYVALHLFDMLAWMAKMLKLRKKAPEGENADQPNGEGTEP